MLKYLTDSFHQYVHVLASSPTFPALAQEIVKQGILDGLINLNLFSWNVVINNDGDSNCRRY